MPKCIYKPFFYIIQDTKTKKYYAGYNSTSDHKLFMTDMGYKTSSTYVKMLIEQHGLDRFRIIKIRLFDTKEQAYTYESRFLRKVDAANNKKFINLHNNIGKAPSFGTKEFEELMVKKYGVKNPMHMPSIIEKIKNTWTEEKRKKRSIESSLLWKNKEFIDSRKKSLDEYFSNLTIEERKNIYGSASIGKKRNSEKYKEGALKRISDPDFSKKLSESCKGIERKPRSTTECKNCNKFFTFQNIKRHEITCRTKLSPIN